MYNIAIIGSGQLGSRHLHGIKNVDRFLEEECGYADEKCILYLSAGFRNNEKTTKWF